MVQKHTLFNDIEQLESDHGYNIEPLDTKTEDIRNSVDNLVLLVCDFIDIQPNDRYPTFSIYGILVLVKLSQKSVTFCEENGHVSQKRCSIQGIIY